MSNYVREPFWEKQSYQDFLALLFIYSASVDLDLSEGEELSIIEKVGKECYERNKRLFKAMKDIEVTDTLYQLSQNLHITEQEKELVLRDVEEVIHRDGRKNRIEEDMLLFIKKLI